MTSKSYAKSATLTTNQVIPQAITEESKAVKKLNDKENVIIRQADKGGGLVIQDREIYLVEALRLLGDNATYEKLPGDPLPGYITSLKQLLDGAREQGVITKNEYLFLNKEHPLTPHFYHIPKIHTDQTNPPGRPIIAGIDSLTNNLGCYIDHFLQEIVLQLPS